MAYILLERSVTNCTIQPKNRQLPLDGNRINAMKQCCGHQSTQEGPLKKAYVAPQLIELGEVEKMTQWLGGPYGEFFGGQGTGWNPFEPRPTGS
jgi:hypothetical protein